MDILKDLNEDLERYLYGSFFFEQNRDLRLELKDDISNMALIIKDYDGRCIDINIDKVHETYILIYHFAIKDIVLNVRVDLGGEKRIDSISKSLASIIWLERKIHQKYKIYFLNHPNIKDIYLDSKSDEENLKDYLPLSKIMTQELKG